MGARPNGSFNLGIRQQMTAAETASMAGGNTQPQSFWNRDPCTWRDLLPTRSYPCSTDLPGNALFWRRLFCAAWLLHKGSKSCAESIGFITQGIPGGICWKRGVKLGTSWRKLQSLKSSNEDSLHPMMAWDESISGRTSSIQDLLRVTLCSPEIKVFGMWTEQGQSSSSTSTELISKHNQVDKIYIWILYIYIFIYIYIHYIIL